MWGEGAFLVWIFDTGETLAGHPRLGVLLFVAVVLPVGEHSGILTPLLGPLHLTSLLSLVLLVLLRFSVHTWNTPFT